MRCPCCGQETELRSPDEVARIPALSNGEREVVKVLVSAYPRNLTSREIGERIYSGIWNGGPDDPAAVVRQQLNRIRRKLSGTGWTVGNGKGLRFEGETLRMLEAAK